jgi:hypothetical protein
MLLGVIGYVIGMLLGVIGIFIEMLLNVIGIAMFGTSTTLMFTACHHDRVSDTMAKVDCLNA